ncbi:MAG TPA: acyl-CoA dehydrogenase family protein [Streptosporangiaceae bacterium]|nr:acyl-CoA dehydrogenase family protein [Streptosporangiaceae bacterium]
MALILTDEEQALADSVRKFVADRSPLTSLRHLISSGEPYDADVWKQMTAQLGLAGLTIPEEYGGVGAGVSALSVALTELGAGLVASPLLASLLAAEVLLRLDDAAAKTELLPRIAGGEVIATVAVASSAGGHVTATGGNGGDVATLSGTISPVLNGAEASVLLVPADSDKGTVIYLVDGAADGLTRTRLTSVDHSRSLARVQLSGTPARALAGDAAAALAAASDLANLALASESAGAMKACLDMTSAYARIRVAFGQPIGAFQAVKHRLADMEKSWELGHAALRDAARAGDAEPGRFSVAASVARVLLASAYADAAVDTVQLHGGIGFTWEHDAHLYYKNGLSNKVLLGGPGDQLDRLADSLGI